MCKCSWCCWCRFHGSDNVTMHCLRSNHWLCGVPMSRALLGWCELQLCIWAMQRGLHCSCADPRGMHMLTLKVSYRLAVVCWVSARLVGAVCPISEVGRICHTCIGCWWSVPWKPWWQSLQCSAYGHLEELVGTSCRWTWFFPWTWSNTCCPVGVTLVEYRRCEAVNKLLIGMNHLACQPVFHGCNQYGVAIHLD